MLARIGELYEFAQPIYLFLLIFPFLSLFQCFIRVTPDLVASAVYRIRLSAIVPLNVY